jgi:hypothetical protein
LNSLSDNTKYSKARYGQEEVNISTLLSEKSIREFLIRLMQARNLSEAKFSEGISALEGGTNIIKPLVDGLFIERETFVECRKTSQKLAHFRGDQIDLSSLEIRCAGCNRPYKDENVYSAIVCTEKLRELLQSSRWMNVLITSYLVKDGIPLEFIFWNVEFGNDELDIIAFIDGMPWVFELKDTEFSASDAHHFNYRRSLIKPLEAFVISTSFVSPDAKRIFNEASGYAPGTTLLSGGSKLPMPILIEGLEGAEETIAVYISNATNSTLQWRVRNALSGIHLKIAEILASKFI